MFLQKRRNYLIILVVLLTIQRILGWVSVGSTKNDVNIPETTYNTLHSLDIYIESINMLQYLIIFPAIYYWRDYTKSSRLLILAGTLYIFLPLILYYLPYNQLLKCSPLGLPDSLEQTFEEYCAMFLKFKVLVASIQVSFPSISVFPAMMSGSALIQKYFGTQSSLKVLNKLIGFGFLPLFTIGFGLLYQYYNLWIIPVTYVFLLGFIFSLIFDVRKGIIDTCIIGSVISGVVMIFMLNWGIVGLLYKVIPRYFLSTVLYSDIVLYFLMYIYKNPSDNTLLNNFMTEIGYIKVDNKQEPIELQELIEERVQDDN